MSFGVPAVAVVPLTASALVLAQQPDSGDNGGQGEDFGKSSPVGLLVLILFLIAVAFLIRSMSKHLKKVPASFEPEEEPAADSTGDKADEAGQSGDDAGAREAEAGTPAGEATAGKKPD
ncbi:hypothetical protein [Amycolatopsis jiangsuensis]|uniref:Na+-transporting methylmalonyl-CoA/oxaloacetate decarboxylase gamma subunit n=1 Tax=Amycolatopsis jiangsuensis TaxID=1181879 RepID=A0A840J0H8_9PSEU|nr:hypothetical protein [Amycolatopsis jiangsuensis]MBB4688466.1 Na+-transporting methylmalonyl-CoA/oxaloacetate decarboxylase gamma subunit [Amycolatopsis jiangsuensis]